MGHGSEFNDYPIHRSLRWKITQEAGYTTAYIYRKSKRSSWEISSETRGTSHSDKMSVIKHVHKMYLDIIAKGEYLPFATTRQKWARFVTVLRAIFGFGMFLLLFAAVAFRGSNDIDPDHWLIWGVWMSFLGWWYATIFQTSFIKDPKVGVVFRKKKR